MYLFTLQKLPGTNWNIRLLILYNYGNIFTRTCNSKLLCRRQTRIHHFSESDAKPSLIQLIKEQLINSFLKRLSLISFIFWKSNFPTSSHVRLLVSLLVCPFVDWAVTGLSHFLEWGESNTSLHLSKHLLFSKGSLRYLQIIRTQYPIPPLKNTSEKI